MGMARKKSNSRKMARGGYLSGCMHVCDWGEPPYYTCDEMFEWNSAYTCDWMTNYGCNCEGCECPGDIPVGGPEPMRKVYMRRRRTGAGLKRKGGRVNTNNKGRLSGRTQTNPKGKPKK